MKDKKDKEGLLFLAERGYLSLVDLSSFLKEKDKSVNKALFGEIDFFIDYSKNIKELMEGEGYYGFDYFSDQITPSFYFKKKIEVSAKIFSFNDETAFEKVLEDIKKESFRPANIFELLYFSKTFPEFQKRFAILAAGSIFFNKEKNEVMIPCLSSFFNHKELALISTKFLYSSKCRFLAIKNN